MKVVFISCYMTHHQLPFCKLLYEQFGQDFCFISDKTLKEERTALGYVDYNKEYDFIIRAYEGPDEKARAEQWIMDADVVILGDAPMAYVRKRLQQRKLTFCYSERLYKKEYQAWKLPVRVLRHYRAYTRHKNFYLLCASAYTAGDYARTGAFLGKAYRWGYFPEVKHYEDVDRLIAQKEPGSILWVGRFLDWKYPDHAIRLAQRLKCAGYRFKLRMIGQGEMDEQLRQTVKQQQLEDVVEFMGSMKPEEVRQYMENSQIYLFTSNRNEGWGAVLNESMNSGCAVVASSCAGSTPFLVTSGENGFSYDHLDEEQLYRYVCTLLDDPRLCAHMGKNAYETMTGMWNAELAAQRFVELCEALLRGERRPRLYENGPCSKAPVIKD